MRHSLRQELESRGSALTWNHITDQIGMFCFTGMTVAEVSDDQRVLLVAFLFYFTGCMTTLYEIIPFLNLFVLPVHPLS